MRGRKHTLPILFASQGVSDTTAPTCVITCTQTSPTTAGTLNFTITFSEAVTGFEVGDFAVTNGTKGALGGSGAVYTCDVTPTTAGTPVTANVAAGVAQDAAGNANLAAAQLSIDYYTAIYYVRKTGNDSTGDGSTGTPWLTLTKALSVAAVNDGDLVRVGDGTYAEGSAGNYWLIAKDNNNWLTIEPENGVSGDVTITGNGHATYNVLFNFPASDYLRFRYLKFGMTANSLQAIRGSGPVTNIQFINCTINPAANATEGLYISSGTATGILVSGCTINRPATNDYAGIRITTTASNTYTITGCTIYGSANFAGGKGLYITGALAATVTVTNCTIDAGYETYITTGGTVALSDCTLTGAECLVGADGSGNQATATTTVTFTNCTINKTGTTGHALIFGNTCTACVADNVTIPSSYDDAIVLKEHTGTEVKNCHVTGGTVAGIYLKAAISANVHNNVVTVAAGYGLQVLKGDSGNKCATWQLQNNTVNVSGSGKALNIGTATDDAGGGICDYNQYQSNSGLGVVRSDANVANLTELVAAWQDYDVTTNDAHSTVV